MSDILLSPGLSIARNRFRYLDATGISRSPYGGVTRTAALLGDRVGASLEVSPSGAGSAAGALARAQLLAFVNQIQGRQNRAMLWDHAYTMRGSFPATELHSNTDFSGGLTGWSDQGNVDATVNDAVYRIIRTVTDGTLSGTVAAIQQHSLTQFLPYLYRFFTVLDGGLINSQIYRVSGADTGATNGVFNHYLPGGLITASGMRGSVIIPGATGNYQIGALATSTTDMANDFQSVLWASAARCALCDANPNMLLRSDDFTNASWVNTRTTDSANTATDPSGGTNADSIIEDATASSTHYIEQAATVFGAGTDYCFTVCLKANTRTWAAISMIESTGSTLLTQYFNLSTGAAGTLATGANWASARVFSVSLGNGWWRYYIVGRKTSAGTTLTCRIFLATADNTNSYSGDGASSIFAWRGGVNPGGGLQGLTNCGGGVPFIPAQTTGSTIGAGTSPAGNQMRGKGFPPSANGVLLPADQFEIITSRGSELKFVTSSVNSDAAGCALINFSPRLRGTVADSSPIILNRPMGRFVFVGDAPEWSTDPGIISAAAFDFEEST